MELNADFSKRAVVHAALEPWVASPMKGVDRRMLDRIGDEVARATSIVRYAPGSQFSAHTHTGGEEFLVLEGTFQDEHGDYPEGTYVRNPPTTSHTPSSAEGCVILVKLWQFDMEDRNQFRVDTKAASYEPLDGKPEIRRLALHSDPFETVYMDKWDAGQTIDLDATDGLELLVIAGSFEENGDTFKRHSWLRLPKGSQAKATTGPDGAKVWIKSGHLCRPPAPPSV